jgi:hypothetical protein
MQEGDEIEFDLMYVPKKTHLSRYLGRWNAPSLESSTLAILVTINWIYRLWMGL